ncbi:MAG: murein L,D-transpeptidase catalytic domain family protein [Flavobacterium sp.]
MKKILSVLLFLALVFSGYSLVTKKSAKNENISKKAKALSAAELTDKRIKEHAGKITEFLIDNPKYNSDIVFLADMKIMSGMNRFFIYDLKKGEVIDKGLVAHGYGSETGIKNTLKFSNTNNSNCTSLGKYSIGESYHGRFGKAYKLYGLDQSNSNAFSRSIVLHKYSSMPYEEQIDPVCMSQGCPMVNETYFKRIEKILDSNEKKILLDIYY